VAKVAKVAKIAHLGQDGHLAYARLQNHFPFAPSFRLLTISKEALRKVRLAMPSRSATTSISLCALSPVARIFFRNCSALVFFVPVSSPAASPSKSFAVPSRGSSHFIRVVGSRGFRTKARPQCHNRTRRRLDLCLTLYARKCAAARYRPFHFLRPHEQCAGERQKRGFL
jgi:hypothetical protein